MYVCNHTSQRDNSTIIVQSKARGSFPAARIKVVTNTDPRAFKRGSLASPDVYFQVNSLLHIKAQSLIEACIAQSINSWYDQYNRAATDPGMIFLLDLRLNKSKPINLSYIQAGDETEVLYLIAPTKNARDKWKEAFLKGESISFCRTKA